jgi:hypothetical protein
VLRKASTHEACSLLNYQIGTKASQYRDAAPVSDVCRGALQIDSIWRIGPDSFHPNGQRNVNFPPAPLIPGKQLCGLSSALGFDTFPGTPGAGREGELHAVALAQAAHDGQE